MRVMVATGRNVLVGGHNTQAAKTADALVSVGVEVVRTDDPNPEPAGFDVLHGFGISASTVRRARQAGVLVAVSPIYWSLRYTQGQERPLTAGVRLGHARMALAQFRNALRGQAHDAAELLLQRRIELGMLYESADVLLPNSHQEAKLLQRELGITTPMVVVPNSADPEVFSPPNPGAARIGVLYVGRIEPHKNQLGLLKALRGTGCVLTLVGPGHLHHPSYLNQVRSLADRVGAEMIDARRGPELAELYRRHRVHVLPSWFETTGLVSLEAALTGSAVVSTSRGYAAEYLTNLAGYCDPAHPRSIRESVLAALEAPRSTALRDCVLENYTWRHTAQATIAAYERALATRGPR